MLQFHIVGSPVELWEFVTQHVNLKLCLLTQVI